MADDEVLQPYNPFTLFLIFILLVLSSQPNVEEKLSMLNSLLQTTRQSVRTFRSGMRTLHASIQPPD
ncbi:hypothetical protein GFC01_13350 [Desulfofundulus thermobenzoicus]|uniref:Uncharacterized protein n=1 Tax=Desulfofundulus thermobenzoicus TaxID=29376 RepID=A0A6N7ISX9_9FIRM|nr:hypothetical protein [Desulfofundulus thermobenzoicus]MQL53226.1 hypothetical protein [Desulfofundulus thermobenzoicus]HHW43818.1 hypothetical protein [Desulfotomaculum sp.]